MVTIDFRAGPRTKVLSEALDDAEALRSTASIQHDAGKMSDIEYDVALKACWDALDAIAAEPAVTLGDLRLKAKAFDWSARLLDDEPYSNPSDSEEKILRQLVAGLLAVVS